LGDISGIEGAFLRGETNIARRNRNRNEKEDREGYEGDVKTEGTTECNGWLEEGDDEEKMCLYRMTRNEGKGWVVDQVMGFEMVEGKRMFCRRTVVRRCGKGEGGDEAEMAMARCVLDFVGEK